MSIYAISDVHVKMDGTNSDILKKFISLPFKRGDKIFFLGDIFDLLIGPHPEYLQLYSWFFEGIEKLAKNEVEIHYFEGNHDFHLEKILEDKGIVVHTSPFVYEVGKKKILFCHGDEIELGNYGYKIYKSFVSSRPLNFVANYIMPYKLLNAIGERASKKSRKRNKNRYGNPQVNELIRDKFRESAMIASAKYQTDIVICGHSHYKDNFSWDTKQYFNCGYLPITQNYILINEEIKHVEL